MASILLAISTGALLLALGQYIFYNLVILLAGKFGSERVSTDFTPPITVIIPAYNEEGHIRGKLENILESDYPKELLEVIVVDDGSTDRTAEIVREFEGVELLTTGERKGKIFVQKVAFERAKNDIIAITDVTVRTPLDALRTLAGHMADPRVGAVSASMTVRNRDVNYMTRISQFLFDIQNAQKLGESRLDSAAGLFGQMSLVRREAVGDFSTDVIYEDREFGITLRKRGWRARIEPGVRAEYHAPESLADFSNQKKRNMGAMTQSLVRHWRLLFNPAYGFYGLLIFPEYSLFRIIRPYLLALSFLGAAAYCLLFEPTAFVPLLSSMVATVFCCYVVGTALLAPLVPEPGKFLLNLLATIPAMALVAIYFLSAGARYFKGDYGAKWKRIRRDSPDSPENADIGNGNDEDTAA
jgi:cellulose synthase/poly-beta-1,6-N-acetylglucosamine synthase-like glycosyltransferase